MPISALAEALVMDRTTVGHAWQKAQNIFEAKFGAENARTMRRTMMDVVRTELTLK